MYSCNRFVPVAFEVVQHKRTPAAARNPPWRPASFQLYRISSRHSRWPHELFSRVLNAVTFTGYRLGPQFPERFSRAIQIPLVYTASLCEPSCWKVQSALKINAKHRCCCTAHHSKHETNTLSYPKSLERRLECRFELDRDTTRAPRIDERVVLRRQQLPEENRAGCINGHTSIPNLASRRACHPLGVDQRCPFRGSSDKFRPRDSHPALAAAEGVLAPARGRITRRNIFSIVCVPEARKAAELGRNPQSSRNPNPTLDYAVVFNRAAR